ncbi:unnamed protein product [Sphagnum balticum]
MNAQESTESVQTSNQPKEDDWESSNTLKSVEAGVSTLKLQTVSLNSNAPVTVSTPVGDGDDIAILDDTPVAEVDPREHLNIVFIGHVDAGKSTLSGAILYCMGK